jgi:pimeloyl-ACP methyl ester carboxylesterase
MIGLHETALPVQFGTQEIRLSSWFRDTDSELVLFVHGLGCSKRSWRDAWSRPEMRGKALLAVDLPGFGHTQEPRGFDYSLEHQAGVLKSLIDGFASRRIHLVAHSMGGTIGLLLPDRILARLAGLYLVEPRLMKSSCGIAAEASRTSFEQFTADVFPRFRRRARGDETVAFDLHHADPEAFYKCSCSLIRETAGQKMIRRFEAAPCRQVFIYGARNSHLDELEIIDPHLTVAVQDAGHFVMHDNPDGFYKQLSGQMAE